MNTILNTLKIAAVSVGLVLLSGCEKDFLDINTDPNNPVRVPLSQLLPYAELNMTNSFGFGTSGLSYPASGFVHQTVTRDNFNTYFAVGNDFAIQQAWDNLYAGALTDMRQLIALGSEQEAWHYVGMAQILRAYTFGQMVDVWGDIPFDEANQGSVNPYPVFQNGQEIYPKILALLDEGIANLAKESALTPGSADLFYSGNVTRWRKLAKTLKLKLYNQVRLTELYDAAAVSALLAEGDLMTAGTDDFEMQYRSTNSPENRHPGFIAEYTQASPNYFISPYFYQIMQGASELNPVLNGIPDPRLPYYFYNQLAPGQAAQNPTSYRDGEFVSIWFGSLNIDPNEGFDQNTSQTVVGLYPVGGEFDSGEGGAVGQTSGQGGAGVQRLFTYAASLFTRAELALTRNTGEDAAALLDAAIRESFREVNRAADEAKAPVISAAATDNYVSSVLGLFAAGDEATKLELILTQKWIASFGFAVDSYTDYRRTGYPKAFDPNTDNNPFTVINRDYIVSFPYPVTELQINPNAGRGPRNIATDKVFWDRR